MTVDKSDFLEVSPYAVDRGELIGRDPRTLDRAVLNSVGALTPPQSYTGEVPGLLRRERIGDTQMRVFHLCALASADGRQRAARECPSTRGGCCRDGNRGSCDRGR